MNTIKEKGFDYQAYIRDNPPEKSKIQRGTEARKQRFEVAKMKRAVRIDEDILEQFRQLAQQDQDYEKLINQALREWLIAKTVKELVREELHQMVQTALSSVQPTTRTAQSKG